MASTKRKSLKTMKERIEEYLTDISSVIRNPERKSNVGNVLYELFIWQTISKFAEDRMKKTYASAQPEALPSDDVLRQNGEGDFIIIESDYFSFTIKVSTPRKNFNLDLFLEEVSKKYHIRPFELALLAEKCKIEGKPSLSKKVLEA